jgi:flagellar hook-length control protein FliK
MASIAETDAAPEGTARLLSASSANGRFHVTLKLEPPELGQLRVQVRMVQHAMTLQVDAESQAVARLIESRLSDLRSALASQGIRMDRTEVVVRSPAQAEMNAQNQNGGQTDSGHNGQGSAGESGMSFSEGRHAQTSGEQPALGDDGISGSEQRSADSARASAGSDNSEFDTMRTTELSLDLVA